jgi:16S rRNA (cytosine1402-N4)-methyltransferase
MPINPDDFDSPEEAREAMIKSSTKEVTPQLNVLTKKPLTPTDEEISLNYRARSAKTRIAEKV